MNKYFVFVEWDEIDISNCLIGFTTLEGAKSWILKNYKKDGEMRLFEGAEIHFEYHEQINIKELDKANRGK